MHQDEFKLVNGIYRMNEQIASPQGAITLIFRDGKTGKIKNVTRVKNMFVTSGKVGLAAGLRGQAGKGVITYLALGTSAVAPALGDTTLTTEIFRKAISVRENTNNVAKFQTYITTSESNGTLREAALFGDDATSVANSGRLYCKAAINRTKSAADTLTLVWEVTIG
jgi:hypothetical protein